MDDYETTVGWDGDGSISQAVVEALAAVTRADPSELRPLNESVDPDALERLFAPMANAPELDGSGRLEFTVDGCRVTVTSDGTVTARRLQTAGSAAAVTDRSAFADALADLVQRAAANGVPVEGGWACRDGAERSEWGVEIYTVRRSDEAA